MAKLSSINKNNKRIKLTKWNEDWTYEKKGPNNFIIGSRFCEGAKSDYKGLRKAISVCGNYFAKKFNKMWNR